MQTLGLHIEGKNLYSILIKSRREKPQVIDYRTLSLVKAPSFVKQIYTKNKGITLTTGLSTEDVVVRESLLNMRSKTTLLSALPFEIESNVPFSPEETVAYTLFKRGKGKKTFVTILASTKPLLTAHLAQWQALQIESDWLSCIPQALFRYAGYCFPKIPSLLLFHVGFDSCSYLVIQDHRLVLSKHIPIGTSHFFEALKKDDPTLSDSFLDDVEISLERTPHLSATRQTLLQELARVKTFLKRKNFDLLPCHLCGKIPLPIGSILSEQFEHLLAPPQTTAALQAYAIPLGLSLDGLYQDSRSVQFRQQFKPAKNRIRRITKILLSYLSVSVVFSLLFGSMMTFGFSAKRHRLEESLSKILEKEVTLEEGIASLENAATKNLSPLSLSMPPKVSDVLQWLGAHPLLKKRPDGLPIEITRMQYKLENYPKLGEKREAYLARVELELSSNSPTKARDFHHALLKGDDLVDEKKEIVWKTSHNAYFVKFYLKNKKP